MVRRFGNDFDFPSCKAYVLQGLHENDAAAKIVNAEYNSEKPRTFETLPRGNCRRGVFIEKFGEGIKHSRAKLKSAKIKIPVYIGSGGTPEGITFSSGSLQS